MAKSANLKRNFGDFRKNSTNLTFSRGLEMMRVWSKRSGRYDIKEDCFNMIQKILISMLSAETGDICVT